MFNIRALLTTGFVLTCSFSVFGQTQDQFTRWDRDEDGKLSRAEVPEGAQSRFDQMDSNRDGFLTRDEQNAFRAREVASRSRQQRQNTQNTDRVQGRRRQRPQPTHANVRYGSHERNVIDLYLAKSDQPTPLVLYIHGGGFRGGDKQSLSAAAARSYLDVGFSVAAINYRLTNTAPAPAAYLDCARALQFLRYHAKKWNLDPRLVASTGGSAGAGTSMWLAFHDDLADPASDDPVARQSTRLTCIAVNNGQSSYDPRFAEQIGIPRPNFERHDFFLPFYDITEDEIDTPKAYKRYEQAAAITYLTKDDPPALMIYGHRNETVTDKTSLGVIVHHPKFGIALKEQMNQLGLECTVQYRSGDGNESVRHNEDEPLVTPAEFIEKHFELARAQLSNASN